MKVFLSTPVKMGLGGERTSFGHLQLMDRRADVVHEVLSVGARLGKDDQNGAMKQVAGRH
jgi:hypothetical protein